MGGEERPSTRSRSAGVGEPPAHGGLPLPRSLAGPLLAALLAPWSAGCTLPYLAKSAAFEAELLARRRPVERVLERGLLPPEQADRLALVDEVRRFGVEQGLRDRGSYASLAVGWERRVWVLVACRPLELEPRRWWFPVVGSVPYLGFFRRQDAERWSRRLEARGYETWLRPAGAWSSLGWFRDPVLPAMLRWPVGELAETVLHEQVHASFWLPGQVDFNESLAQLLGEVLAERFLARRFGPGSEELRSYRERRADGRSWARVLRAVYQDLDAAYRDPSLDREARLDARKALLGSIPARVEAAPLHHPEPYLEAARQPWNEARLLQYGFYDRYAALLGEALDAVCGDVSALLGLLRRELPGQRDPAAALRAALEREETARCVQKPGTL